ncbi:MAG: pyruvate kinase [Chthonomonas sp.]|nr:pyruvate kinase [Chthonomonas sp.]
MRRRTKIVATLGPAIHSQEKLLALLQAGVNVLRLNCSHGDWDAKRQWIAWLRDSEFSNRVGVLADLQGPKIRLGILPNDAVTLETGQTATITQLDGPHLSVPDERIFNALALGDRVLIGDGHVELRVTARVDNAVMVSVISGGVVKTKQGVTVVGRSFPVESLTAKDRDDVRQACAAGVDFIALSYVRTADEMVELRDLVNDYDPFISLCAKVETREAVRNIDSIIEASDVIMVARGDLGLQVDIEDVPIMQKQIIRRCLRFGKPVITATQMMESMIDSPRPTRAEATDIANAVMDGTDALMLSGETAAGNFPLECVRTMAKIAERSDGAFDHESHFDRSHLGQKDVDIRHTEAVAQSAVQLATTLKTKAIVCTSTSGMTPRLVAKFRPDCPVFCATWDPRVQRRLSISWGVETALVEFADANEEVVRRAIGGFKDTKRLRSGDPVVVTAGVPAGVPGRTNLIQFEFVD